MAIIDEKNLPVELGTFESVEIAYSIELERCKDSLVRGLPVLVECDKGLVPFFYKCLRDRLKRDGLQCIYLDGRPPPNQPENPMGMAQTITSFIICQLKDAVRGAIDQKVVVLPHLDLLTTDSGILTSEAKEVIPLLYENPNILWVGFKDPSFAIPSVIKNLFPNQESIIGIPRDKLQYLVTQREARKLGRGLNPYKLYKYVSGLNVIRLRRVLSSLNGEDYPTDDRPVWRQLRSATMSSTLSLPDLNLHKDIGGYIQVKDKIQREILDLITYKESLDSSDKIEMIEKLIPRGMLFCGPPGTGKTLFAKAIASALGAAVIVVSGPELKSRWVGASEAQLRQIFTSARKAAPSVIIFDELDSFASARGTYTGSGVEHSMVNQLLTELDGFQNNEMVFVIGTTNFVESIDPALLRPGRLEFHLEVPYPNAKDREAIFKIYDKMMDLHLSEEALEFAIKCSGFIVEGGNTRYSGDHIQALCRAIARKRLRERKVDDTTSQYIQQILDESHERPVLNSNEEKVVATHEAGHALVSMHCEHTTPIDKISIKSEYAGSLGYVKRIDPTNKYVVTKNELLDQICILFGGREAENLLLDELSLGSAQDIEHATSIAKMLVEKLGMGSNDLVCDFIGDVNNPNEISEQTRFKLDHMVNELMSQARARACNILKDHKAEVIALRDLLLEKKTIDRQGISNLIKRS